MSDQTFTTVLDGLHFAEGPRWHAGALWFSDMHDHAVYRLAPDEAGEVVARIPDDRPSGLGWLPDGRLLVSTMLAQRVLRLEPDGSLVVHADLSGVAVGDLNDMIVDARGVAYVGDMGYRLDEGVPAEVRPGSLFRVSPDGSVALAAADLGAPNGPILTPDEATLILAESRHGRLSAFPRHPDGSLGDPRPFADLTASGRPATPDGICLDAEGAVWWCDPVHRAITRTLPGGHDTHRWEIDEAPVACVLGDADRRTLYVSLAQGYAHEQVSVPGNARIGSVRVEVPGAGRP